VKNYAEAGFIGVKGFLNSLRPVSGLLKDPIIDLQKEFSATSHKSE